MVGWVEQMQCESGRIASGGDLQLLSSVLGCVSLTQHHIAKTQLSAHYQTKTGIYLCSSSAFQVSFSSRILIYWLSQTHKPPKPGQTHQRHSQRSAPKSDKRISLNFQHREPALDSTTSHPNTPSDQTMDSSADTDPNALLLSLNFSDSEPDEGAPPPADSNFNNTNTTLPSRAERTALSESAFQFLKRTYRPKVENGEVSSSFAHSPHYRPQIHPPFFPTPGIHTPSLYTVLTPKPVLLSTPHYR